MNGFVKWMDDAPLWLKIIFALPVLNIVWAVYRIVKGCATKNVLMVVVGILWIFLGATILWLVDLVSICVWKQPKLFA